MITYKVRIYPNKEQQKLIDKMLWESKCLYNWLLECHQDVYNSTRGKCKVNLNKFDLEVFRKQFKSKHLPSQIQQSTCGRLTDAYKRFFSGQNGYPKFKSIRQFRSITYPQYKHGFNFDSKHVKLTNLGKLKAIFDRPIQGTPKTCTLKKMPSGKYYAFIVSDNSKIPSIPIPTGRKRFVGIDPGLEKFCTLSDGQYVRRPVFLKKEQIRLTRAQRKLSRKKKGSRNFRKQSLRLAKIHEKIKNRRRDHHFKVAHWLTHNYETLCVEALSPKFMIEKRSRKSKSLTKSATDVALYEFLMILHYMSNKYHSTIIDVDPRGTSQMCSRCGSTVRKSLEMRTHVCPVCGLAVDRDLNAALNILRKGLPGCGTEGSSETITLVEINIPGV